MSGPQRKRLLSIGTFGTLLTLLVLAAESNDGLSTVEDKLYDIRARHCQKFGQPPTDELVHVDIDDGALAHVGEWPWSRSLMAELVSEMHEAGAKLIVLDVLFPEARRPELILDSQGIARQLDHDGRLAEAIARAGNVVVAASMTFTPPAEVDPIQRAAAEELFRDPELQPADVVARLAARGLTAPDMPEQVVASFVVLRGEAIFRRIDRELKAGVEVSSEELAKRLLPKTVAKAGTRFPLERRLEEEHERVLAVRAFRRFGTVPAGTSVPLIESSGGLLPISRLGRSAAYGGFVDFLPEGDGIVRSVPLTIGFEGRALPQISLAAACAAMGVDVERVRVAEDEVLIPQASGGELRIPTRGYPGGTHAGKGGFFDIPFFGRGNWERMYDFPDHRAPKARVGVMEVVAACDTRERITANDLVAAGWLARVLDATDPDTAAEIRRQPPLGAELVQQVDDALENLSAATESLSSIPDLQDEEIAQLKQLQAAGLVAGGFRIWRGERTKLVRQLADQRATLAPRLKDKVVFVGSIATGAYDFVPSSIDPKCPGVYLHSAVFNAIVTGEFWRRAPRWVTMLAIAVVGLLTTAAAAFLTPPKAFAVVLILAGGYAAVNGYVWFDRGNLIVGAAGPLVAAGVVWSGVTLIQFIREIGERTRLTRRFRSYVDPTLVSYLIENPDEARLVARERELTVAFTDLAGFTTLSERLRAESAKMLGSYMETMVPLIRARGGYVNKFLGDGIMFFFGAPIENPRHAAGAVAAVLDMQEALGPFNADLERRGLPTLSMRAGVSTGQMVVGDAGPSFASDYTVLGDAVNLAARLESANKAMGTQNLITARTVDLLAGEYLTRPIANLLVIGKNQSVWVHEAVAPLAAATEDQKRLVSMTATFVQAHGRQDFDACIQACRTFEEAFGPSKLAALYASEAETCRRSPPDDGFCGLIKLQEK